MKKEIIKTSIAQTDIKKEDDSYAGDRRDSSNSFENNWMTDYPIEVNQLEDIHKEVKFATKILLNQIKKIYNKKFNLNENERYYKIIIGRWLYHFINNIYENLVLIKNEKKRNSDILTQTSDFDYELSRNSDSYYQKSYSSHLFKNKMLSSIINLDNDFKKIRIGGKSKKSFYKKFKEKIKPLFGKTLLLMNRIFLNDLILVVDPYYPKGYFINSIWFFLKSKGKIVHQEFNLKESNRNLDYLLRYNFDSLMIKSDNELLNISSRNLFKFIPICYLEQFMELRNKAEEWHLKNINCNRFFTANSIHSNELFKFLVASNQKIPLSIVQHGQGYGTWKTISAEEYEKSLADKYYTWGWGDLKLPHPKLLKCKTIHYKNNDRIIFTFPSITIYSGLLETIHLHLIKKHKIIEDSNTVVNELLSEIKDCLVKRELKQDNLTTLHLNDGLREDKIKDFHTSLYNSKIHLTNHFGTPFLESISMNIPTVLFLSNFKDYLRDEVIDIFLELKDANIIFDNPKLASTHINKYYDSIDDWWLKDSTQQIITKFKSKFCISDSNWKNIWLKELLTKN